MFSAEFFSHVGLPLTAGFIGQSALFFAAAERGLRTLLILLVANGAIGLYYYLRMVATMSAAPESSPEMASDRTSSLGDMVVLGALLLFLIAVGSAPQGVIQCIQSAAATVTP